ncbi:GpE family phage tail protein [Halomonas alkalicola]|nr:MULTISPECIES: GpE family phage tail protein [Halomonas]AXY41076.1 GpE family phage tail protein [Halomonas sp. JS92-SW72]
MADIAMVFHWGPESMAPMPLEELMAWRERARQRVEAAGRRHPSHR